MSFRGVIALGALLLINPVWATESFAEGPSGDAKAGETKAAVCAACHGMDGNPSTNQYPKLAGQHENYIARALQLYKSNKRQNPIMLGFATPLSTQDMHDIGAFFATKHSLPGIADDKLIARGGQLYRGGDQAGGVPACMACHGPDGRGNPAAGYPQVAGQYADYVSAKLKEFRDAAAWGEDEHSKIMPLIAKRLNDADITAVSSYIEGLHASVPVTAAK